MVLNQGACLLFVGKILGLLTRIMSMSLILLLFRTFLRKLQYLCWIISFLLSLITSQSQRYGFVFVIWEAYRLVATTLNGWLLNSIAWYFLIIVRPCEELLPFLHLLSHFFAIFF